MKMRLMMLGCATMALAANAEVQEIAHYNLQGQGAAAPEIWKSVAPGGPDLVRQGSPRIKEGAPDTRQKVSASAMQFYLTDQCYSVGKSLVSGDNFVLEAWALSMKEDDGNGNSFHSVVANGDGGTGFLLAQHGGQWAVLVGGVGVVNLGAVKPNVWTHLAVVKDGGAVTGWLNGEQVADLPNLGGGHANFSIGATGPGKEPFGGLVSEVRYSSFKPGGFNPAKDLLTPLKKHKVSTIKELEWPELARQDDEPNETSGVKHSQIQNLKTRYANIRIDDRGFITSIVSAKSGKEYSPVGHPSPLMSLHENNRLVYPTSAAFNADKQEMELKYPNGATAVVKASAKEDYFRFQLVSLTPRGNVDNIVWGPLHTTVSKIIGDMIGVVRDDDWAIGLYGLDDNTIAGPPVDGDCYGMGYFIHSPDPVNDPVPKKYHEGQSFNVGGDGTDDHAFYSHPEEYFQAIFGHGAELEPEFGSTVAYHARDRRKSYVHFFSLLPGMQRYRARHQVSDPLEGVDFIGSGVALYACPDDEGLHTIENIMLAERLPHVVIDGKWIRDPSTAGVTLNWNGAYDKCIDYAKALGVKDVSRDTGEFYPCLGNNWSAGNVSFTNRPPMSFKDFAAECHRNGLSNGGLHSLCLFLQGGISHDVTPVPSEHLQTVCRTKLAKDISETDTEIVVTDPSFLAERGTWHWGDESSWLRIGGEMMWYDGISTNAPWTIRGVKRGHASKAAAHKAGDELVKLQQNCFNGFVPDMTLMLDYADYYADLMYRNGMDAIGFDGFESTLYQNQGYYGVRIFCRRLFETYSKLTGGKVPRVTGSNVFAGSWEFMNACNVGGGDAMFNAQSGRRGIEGKDIGEGFSRSYYSATFGIQGWHCDWSLYDAENLQAKLVGWNATCALSVSQNAIDATGERDAIFPAFRAWQAARAAQVFSKTQKEKLRDPEFKFHLEQTGAKKFVLYPIKEIRISENAGSDTKTITVTNSQAAQPLQFALQLASPVNICIITLPDGTQIKTGVKIEKDQYIICKGGEAHLADHFRKKIAALPMSRPTVLPKGESKIGVQFPGPPGTAKTAFALTTWIFGQREEIRK